MFALPQFERVHVPVVTRNVFAIPIFISFPPDSSSRKFVVWNCAMASQTQGIQQLLAAEKKAAERVAEARKRELQSY
jgi:hypothetical protein